jgi:transglutaminase-like putative cysteine protease
MDEYLRATAAIEVDHPAIQAKARELVVDADSAQEQARRLFAFERDGIPYNVFLISMHPGDVRASFELESGKGYCVQKAVLLCSLARASGIPARLALARIRNHRVPEKLRVRLGTDIFPGHGYDQLFIDGRWVWVAATFDAGLCAQVGVPVVDFDGQNDALLPSRALDGGRTSSTWNATDISPIFPWTSSRSARP